ncbi:hypothetical protein E9993_12415 [Labilibacter sediminis]|nr:hypothetical protein E9993_12415 [Labilibacter sediminis]
MKKFLWIATVALIIFGCEDEMDYASKDIIPSEDLSFTIENLQLDGGEVDDFRFVITNTSEMHEDATFAWQIEGRSAAVVNENELVIRVKTAGTYKVTLTVVDGDRTGVLTKDLVQDLTYDGMSDASLEMFALLTNNGAGQAWVLDPTVAGFLGSGAAGADQYDRWWDAAIGDKDGAEIMDDEFIFYGDGTFEVNTNGKTQTQAVDVLRGRSYYTVTSDGQYDLQVDVDDEARKGYAFSLEENDDEDPVAIKLSSEHVCIGYDDENTQRRYEFLDDEDGDPKTMYLRIVSATENRYCKIIPKGYEPVREAPAPRDVISAEDLMSLLTGDDSNGRTWTLDNTQVGHLGVHGWAAEYAHLLDPSKWWWAADADQQANMGLYDDEFTFYPDGTYSINTHGVTFTMAAQEGLDAGYYTAAAGDPAGETQVFVDDSAREGNTYTIVTDEDEDGNKYIYIQLSSPDVCIGFHDDRGERKYEVFAYTDAEDKTLFLGSTNADPMYRFNKLISKNIED